MRVRNNNKKKTLKFFFSLSIKKSKTIGAVGWRVFENATAFFTFRCLWHTQQDVHIKKFICTKKRGLSSPDHWKTLANKKRERQREETGLSFEVLCSTFGISGSIYYLWFHFICVTPSFPCIRRTTSFALMSEAEISWFCSGDIKNLWTHKSKLCPAWTAGHVKVHCVTKCLWKHVLWIMIYLFAPENNKAEIFAALKGQFT